MFPFFSMAGIFQFVNFWLVSATLIGHFHRSLSVKTLSKWVAHCELVCVSRGVQEKKKKEQEKEK